MKRAVSGFVVMAVLCSVPACEAFGAVYSESNYEEFYTPVDGNQISEERLSDNIMEYEELGSLIHKNNPSVREIADSTDRSRQDYSGIRDYLDTEREDTKRKKENAKDSGDMEDYAEYASLEAIYSASAKSYNKMYENMDKKGPNKARVSIEKQLTDSAQELMISYQSLTLQKENLEKLEELYHALYENAETSLQAGLATAQDVQTACKSWLNAQVSLSSISDSTDSLYQSLCLLTGMNEDGSTVIAKIPSADSENLSEMNLETDLEKAVNNNTDIISIRSDTSDSSTSGMELKQRKEDEGVEKAAAKFRQLHSDLQQASAACSAARTGLSGAEITWKNVRSKYSMGMLSKAEYLQSEIQYIQKKNTFESADLTLLQAMETYDWAVKGIMQLD